LQQTASTFSSWFQFLYNGFWVGHQAHVSTLSSDAIGRYPAGYVFPLPVGVPAFAS
jgi:hypothetical protein